ncbi:DNA alkylation repair protein [uncultured Methylobacterium sp.]|jgi:3-methyladenine DNA glycosylase AlkC|uniref:DNA alkylation repair protein n=1 Tax=uncultured Methylobacterium sp. TaxID=157278 RepID=UPI002618130B|nr:DNA alkylation repair protein [uncultured Methylobacterium sp.]
MNAQRRAAVAEGRAESATLAEILAVDLAALFGTVFPDLAAEVVGPGFPARAGILARMTTIGERLHARLGPGAAESLRHHPSDLVRGWACFVVGAGTAPLPDRLAAIRPLADDRHFGVREWAWLAVRPAIAAAPDAAIGLLASWTGDPSERVRRFASEATRPCGVWCRHLASLKADPAPGLAILAPLRADPARTVQDSVGNWLNDAARLRPDWVRAVVAQWRAAGSCPATERIARRGLRSCGP